MTKSIRHRQQRITTHLPTLAALASTTAMIWYAGLLIRLLLMPFSAHLDLYHIYSRSHEAVYDGAWFNWGSQIFIQTVHDIWLLLINPLLPGSEGIWSDSASTLGSGARPEEFIGKFLTYPELPRALFLLKLPYLIADLATGYLLTRLVSPARQPWVLALWLLNPLVIYTSAIFGRHDSIAVFLVVLSALMAQRGWRFIGLGFLVLGSVARLFPIFLAPIYVVAFSRTRREMALLFGGLAGAWLSLELLAWGVTGSSPTLSILNRYQHVEYLVQMQLPMIWDDNLFIFPAAYAVFFLWFLDRGLTGIDAYLPVAAATFLLLFSLTFFHPPYAIWLVPFLALTIDRNRELVLMHAGQVILLALYALHWGNAMSTDLFLPVAGETLASFPDPLAIVAAQMPAPLFLGIVRSLFTALSLWLAYRVVRSGLRTRTKLAITVTRNGHDELV